MKKNKQEENYMKQKGLKLAENVPRHVVLLYESLMLQCSHELIKVQIPALQYT